MLAINDLVAAYGGIRALDGITMQIHQGEVVSVLGSNGAGKTTLLKCICSAMKPVSGTIMFEGKPIPGKTYDVAKAGIGHVPEGRQIFTELQVIENLMAGAYLRTNPTEIQRDLEHVYELFPRLKEREHQYGGHLSGGEQQMLAIGRALMSRPKLLILDEPSLGLAPIIVTQIFSIIKKLKEEGSSILLIEQNAYKALAVSDRAYVFNVGRIVNEGSAKDLIEDKSLVEAYLGE